MLPLYSRVDIVIPLIPYDTRIVFDTRYLIIALQVKFVFKPKLPIIIFAERNN